MIDNLLSNAFKFTLAGSKVSIHVHNKSSLLGGNKGVRIEISDEGPGVPDEFKERVFDKFAIVEMRGQNVPQLGLGLAFCKMVVVAHGGDIHVEDNTPQGAKFVIDL